MITPAFLKDAETRGIKDPVGFELTPHMRLMLDGFVPGHQTGHDGIGYSLAVTHETALMLIARYSAIVNNIASHNNSNPNYTSALAAIKRIRKALGLKSADFAKNPNLRGR